MELTQSYIDSLAPNADAASNGKSLAKKGSFTQLSVSKEDDLLFGLCAGSGKNPYVCSVDFIDKTKGPAARCSCPSRQIPCKHALGLMYAYANGAAFAPADVPQDILDKRNKAEKRQEAKAKSSEKAEAGEVKPLSKAQVSSALKKIDAQIEGIAVADKLLQAVVSMGLAGIDAKTASAYKEQVKQLGNYYIDGIQSAFNGLFLLLEEEKGKDYAKSVFQAQYLKALLKKSAEYLGGKKEAGDVTRDAESAIEAQIGHDWKLDELRRYGKCRKGEELLQLAFYSYGDDSRKEFVDEGYFISLGGGEIYAAKNYRPYKALKHVKEEDSVFDVIKTEELMVYPGDMNPRARWDACSFRETGEGDCRRALSFAKPVYADVIKAVKNQIKSPLADRNPLALLLVSGAELLVKDGEELLVIRDRDNGAQILCDSGPVGVKTVPLLKRYASALKNAGLLVMYHNDIAAGRLCAKPLSVVTEKSVTRLVF